MHLTIIHGSPRGQRSNGARLAESFVRGLQRFGVHQVEQHYLAPRKDYDALARVFANADRVLVVCPLYTDSMPGIVKEWIEQLPAALFGQSARPRLLSLIHSGFPEAIHCRSLERYFARLATRLGCPLDGIMIKGGSEGISTQPAWMRRPYERTIERLGEGYAKECLLAPELLKKLAGTERYEGLARLGLSVGVWLSQGFWNDQLKKNNAYPIRFDRPLDGDCPRPLGDAPWRAPST